MFTGTILENLLLGLEGEVDEHLILKVCEQVDILADIQKMPLGFQTQVSEDGCQVKCGRCVGHARSLLPEAPVERRRQMEPAGA